MAVGDEGSEAVVQLSQALESACERLRGLLHPDDDWAWVGLTMTDTVGLLASPLGELVSALGDTPDSAAQGRRWGRLCVAVAQRVLPCWAMHCDTDPLTQRIQAASDRLFRSIDRGDWTALERVPVPTYRGVALPDDGDVTTPNNAALAVAWCVFFVRAPCPNYVVGCVREVDRAFSQSGLRRRDQFRRWVLEFVVPAAWEDRELTPLERGALRDYKIEQVRRWRDNPADPDASADGPRD